MSHSLTGPSGAHRWMVCPGSVALHRVVVDDPAFVRRDSIYSVEGTAAHALLEKCLRDGRDPEEFLGEVILTHDEFGKIVVDEDMIHAIRMVIDYLQTTNLEIIAIEAKVGISDTLYGTVDIALIGEDILGDFVLEVVDLKYGKGKYVPEDTVQTKIYGLYVFHALQQNGSLGRVPDKFRCTIVQPRHTATPKIRGRDYTPSEMQEFTAELLYAEGLTRDHDAPLVPGDEQCRWCPGKAICPAYREYTLAQAQEEFDALPDLVDVDLDKLGSLLKTADRVEEWVKMIREHAKSLADTGRIATGYKLVNRRGRRTWRGTEEKTVEFLAKSGLGINDYAPRSLVSPAKAEKLGAILTEEEVQYSISGTKLVKADAPGEAVEPPPQFTSLD